MNTPIAVQDVMKEVLKAAGVVSGRVIRIGLVHPSGDVQGYWAIWIEARCSPYRVVTYEPILAETLALTLPGDYIKMTVNVRVEEAEDGLLCMLVEFLNETLTEATDFTEKTDAAGSEPEFDLSFGLRMHSAAA
jgi:hypothetical protein